IFQAVWLDCFRQLASLRNMERLQPWLIRVAVRKCHRFSTDKRARTEDSIPEEQLEELAGSEDSTAIFAELDNEQLLRAELETWKRSHELSSDLVRNIWTRLQDLLTVDPRAGLRLSEWMISVALDLKQPSMQALAMRAKGNALVSLDDYFQGIEYFDEALK